MASGSAGRGALGLRLRLGRHPLLVRGLWRLRSRHERRFKQDFRDQCVLLPPTANGKTLIQDVVDNVDKSLSSRLSQLELYCHNLDKSIGQMWSEISVDGGDADAKLKSLGNHLQEVHRSVQILRDKQEIAYTQKELAKFRLSQKDSSCEHLALWAPFKSDDVSQSGLKITTVLAGRKS
ncbi:hypothetical protein SAY86_017839 [Trapa natans]|uniref:Uncharacterized protein n=1 Tax=Trapa natans TaxID=22666 RepID=A0AAN7R703_TRANT|nr:hypothetical protein SAY86_017839 [Trapa natans]